MEIDAAQRSAPATNTNASSSSSALVEPPSPGQPLPPSSPSPYSGSASICSSGPGSVARSLEDSVCELREASRPWPSDIGVRTHALTHSRSATRLCERAMLRTNTAGVFIGCVFLLLQVRMEEALLLGERAIGERDSARAEADGLRAQLQDALARCVTVFSSLAVALAKTDHLLRQARNGHEKDRTSNTPNCLSLAQACSPDAICRCVQHDRLMFVQTKTIPLLIQASKANQRGATNRRLIVYRLILHAHTQPRSWKRSRRRQRARPRRRLRMRWKWRGRMPWLR